MINRGQGERPAEAGLCVSACSTVRPDKSDPRNSLSTPELMWSLVRGRINVMKQACNLQLMEGEESLFYKCCVPTGNSCNEK